MEVIPKTITTKGRLREIAAQYSRVFSYKNAAHRKSYFAISFFGQKVFYFMGCYFHFKKSYYVELIPHVAELLKSIVAYSLHFLVYRKAVNAMPGINIYGFN